LTLVLYDICDGTELGILVRYSKKGTGYNFCDTILPYHNSMWN